jgi:hypothetical protein
MGLLELAHLTALEHQGFAINSRQGAHRLEAVDGVLGRGMPFGPALEPSHWHFVKHFLDHCLRRSLPPQQCGREGVGMNVQADHPLNAICFLIHFLLRLELCRRTETGQAITCTQVYGAAPMEVLFANAHSQRRRGTPSVIYEHLPQSRLLVS